MTKYTIQQKYKNKQQKQTTNTNNKNKQQKQTTNTNNKQTQKATRFFIVLDITKGVYR
jgi:hypothetical protein